jgi:hypothetical protein
VGCQICLHNYSWCVLHSVTGRIRLQSSKKGICDQRGAVGWFELSSWFLRYWKVKYFQKRWGTMSAFFILWNLVAAPLCTGRILKTCISVFVFILFESYRKLEHCRAHTPRMHCICIDIYLHRDESCSACTELTTLTYVLCLVVRMSRKHMACSG